MSLPDNLNRHGSNESELFASGNGIKRNVETEINDNLIKKPKTDTTSNFQRNIIVSKVKSKRFGDGSHISKQTTKKESPSKHLRKETVVGIEEDVKINTLASKDDLIRNINSTSPIDSSNSTDEYVILPSNIMDMTVNVNYLVDNNSPVPSSNVITRKVQPDFLNTESIEKANEVSEKETDVGIRNQTCENEKQMPASLNIQDLKVQNGQGKSGSNISNTNISENTTKNSAAISDSLRTVAFNRVNSSTTRSSTTLINRVNIHSALKQNLTTNKKLITEVTQTTAKVAIGNTTISVPLLKPHNSAQIIHSNAIEPQKHSTSKNLQISSQHQISVSKILNLKRGQKVSQPTIVSLSQLQIKPVSTAKIVQAKVVNNKGTFQSQVQGQKINSVQTHNMVTITTPKSNISLLHKFTLPKLSQMTSTVQESIPPKHLKSNTTPSNVEPIQSVNTSKTEDSYSEIRQKVIVSKSSSVENKKISAKDVILSDAKGFENIEMKNITSIKKLFGSPVPISPLLKPLLKPAEHTDSFAQNTKNGSRSNALIHQTTASKAIATLSSSVVPMRSGSPDSSSIETVAGNSTSSHISTVSKINTSSFIAIPKNISLMYSKSPLMPQSKSLHAANSTSIKNVSCTSENLAQNINSTQANMLNIKKINMTQVHRETSASVDSKQGVISLTIQPTDAMNPSLDNMTDACNPLKVLPTSCAALRTQSLKRSSSLDESERDLKLSTQINSKRLSIEIVSTKQIAQSEDQQILHSVVNTTTNAKENVSAVSISKSSLNNDNVPKAEETHNVLLKQLLQNTCASNNTGHLGPATSSCVIPTSIASDPCSQLLSARKVINVRAPSLGLVSSLEAQLARPVIPPVQANTQSTTKIELDAQVQPNRNLTLEKVSKIADVGIAMPSADIKPKTAVQMISKETSFVSNPNLKLNIVDAKPLIQNSRSISVNATVNVKDNYREPIKDDKMENETKSSVQKDETKTTNKSKSNELFSSKINQNCSLKSSLVSLKNVVNTDAKLNSSPTASLNSSFFCNNDDILLEEDKKTQSNQSPLLINFVNSSGLSSHLKPTSNPIDVPVEIQHCNNLSNSTQQNNNVNENLAAKELELRKRRKREYQKQRRQILSSSKVLSFGTNETAKKKPRKVFKHEEDYDNYIDNLITRIRQMQPLQVIEPLLNRASSNSDMYERSNPFALICKKSVENQSISKVLHGSYGNATFHYLAPLCVEKRFNSLEENEKKKFSTIHNDFYDQEFNPILYRNENCKHFRLFQIFRDRNADSSNIIQSKSNNRKSSSEINCNCEWSCLHKKNFPGLLHIKFNECQYLERMSPILSIVDSFALKIKRKFHHDRPIALKLHQTALESKRRNGAQAEKKSKTVYLSLTVTFPDNILKVLRDLANILQISSPIAYTHYNSSEYFPGLKNYEGSIMKMLPNNYYQQILNGQCKSCRSCGLPIMGIGIRAEKSSFSFKSVFDEVQAQSTHYHFCRKACVDNFRYYSANQSTLLKINAPEAIEELNKRSDNSNLHTLQNNNAEINTSIQQRARKANTKYFSANCFHHALNSKDTGRELTDSLLKMNITVTSTNTVPYYSEGSLCRTNEDRRQCILCCRFGDGASDGSSRLLNFEVNKWVHLNCALWSNGVYETISGGLMNFQHTLQVGLNQTCISCQQLGATIKCFKNRCGAVYHLHCALKDQCVFYKNKTLYCQQHSLRTEKENELTSLTVQRRVYVERDENRQVASVMHHTEPSNLLRIGSLTFLNIGQLLPHQLEAFHNVNYIYPIGYKIIRFYWSMTRPNKRCQYICSIAEIEGRPEFRIQVREYKENDIEFRDSSPKAVWQRVLEPILVMRKEKNLVQIFPEFISGEDLFGLTEPAIVRIIESLPGIETLTNYRFKYGRNPLLELPLAINPSGSARTELKNRQLLGWRKPHTQRTGTTYNQRIVNPTSLVVAGEVACPYSKQFVHSKSSQYKKMKQEWRNNVYLARSKIQGLGLYAARDVEKHTMIIEYIGEVIRTEVSEIREKQYEAKNRGIYMFRLDEDRVVDATLSGGLARYINHSCNPNCVTEIVEVDRELRIIIFAKRRINRSEELSYDYKFDIEDDAHKIPCMCGSPNCRKWMN